MVRPCKTGVRYGTGTQAEAGRGYRYGTVCNGVGLWCTACTGSSEFICLSITPLHQEHTDMYKTGQANKLLLDYLKYCCLVHQYMVAR